MIRAEELAKARILVVDDQPANVFLLERLLKKAGYEQVETTTDPRDVARLNESFDPDLILLDLHMPHLDGLAVLDQLEAATADGDYRPVLVLTADVASRAKEEALSKGANDFLTKPFDQTEVLLRIRNLLETRFLHLQLKDQNEILEDKVRERTREIWEIVTRLERAEKEVRLSQEETIRRLSLAAEFRDDDTARHVHRMSRYCAALAEASGFDPQRCELIRLASQMHDVGKIGTPDDILLKPGALTPEERAVMEEHATIGYRILSGSDSELLQVAATIALTHHEKVDGSGYPQRLTGIEIPIEGRVAAIADVFDALTSDRVYRRAFPLARALDVMREGRGAHFDPELLDRFFDSLPAVLTIHEESREQELTARSAS